MRAEGAITEESLRIKPINYLSLLCSVFHFDDVHFLNSQWITEGYLLSFRYNLHTAQYAVLSYTNPLISFKESQNFYSKIYFKYIETMNPEKRDIHRLHPQQLFTYIIIQHWIICIHIFTHSQQVSRIWDIRKNKHCQVSRQYDIGLELVLRFHSGQRQACRQIPGQPHAPIL